jgi:hypothetical protein
MMLLRMVPFVERNYNMVELGPRGTGKSHLFQQVSPYAHLISGGKATVARMFVNNANGQRGLVCQYDVVCFDEISGVSFDQKDGVNIMKGYMESGEFSRGKGEHSRRWRHRDGWQLRRGRAAPAAGWPSFRPAAARDASRHRVHGPHPRLPARLGFAESKPRAADRSLRPCQRLPVRVLEPVAAPEPAKPFPGAHSLGRCPERTRHDRRTENRQRAHQAGVSQPRHSRSRRGAGVGVADRTGVSPAGQGTAKAHRIRRVS